MAGRWYQHTASRLGPSSVYSTLLVCSFQRDCTGDPWVTLSHPLVRNVTGKRKPARQRAWKPQMWARVLKKLCLPLRAQSRRCEGHSYVTLRNLQPELTSARVLRSRANHSVLQSWNQTSLFESWDPVV